MESPLPSLLFSRDPEVMSGALVFQGTRVPVKALFDYLEGGKPLDEFLVDFPSAPRPAAVNALETLVAHEAAT